MKTFLILSILVVGTSLAAEYYYSNVNCGLSIVRPSDIWNTILTTKDVSLENCTEAKILWNYPVHNLTIAFSAPKSKPFEFCLKDLYDYFNQTYKVDSIAVYRVENSKEFKITKGADKICMKSGNNNIFNLKLAASSQLKYYGVVIDYSIKV